MRITYTYECEECGESERLEFRRGDHVPERMECPDCKGRMVRLMPKPAVHNGLKRRS